MNWKDYKNEFALVAQRNNYPQGEAENLLEYAQNLFNKGLPIIFDIKHLSLLVGYNTSYINRATKKTSNFYRHFEVRKKNGGVRDIYEPLPSLKEIQKWILLNVLYKCRISKYAKAYVLDNSIKDAARFHKNQKYVLTIDIENFFGNIPLLKSKKIFHELGYNDVVADTLAELCCLRGTLPQGAPTSPALSNIIFRPIDDEISSYCEDKKIRYTRYADDLIFSGNFNPTYLINTMSSILSQYDFKVNDTKTKIMRPWQRQIVTGIIVNNKPKLQTPIEIRSKLRQDMYYITKFGLDSHLEHTKNERSRYLVHLLGIANHILFINPNDATVINYARSLKELLSNQ